MKYILNGIEFKPNNVGIFIGNYSKGHNPIVLAESELIALGATPVDSELNKKHSTGDSTCEKCGERELKKNYCHKCRVGDNFQYVDESECDCDCHQPKEEKIEVAVLYNIEEIDDLDISDPSLLSTTINQLIRNQKAIINKLNGDN